MISLSPPQTAFRESGFPFVNEWSPIRKLGIGFDISSGLPVTREQRISANHHSNVSEDGSFFAN